MFQKFSKLDVLTINYAKAYTQRYSGRRGDEVGDSFASRCLHASLPGACIATSAIVHDLDVVVHYSCRKEACSILSRTIL